MNSSERRSRRARGDTGGQPGCCAIVTSQTICGNWVDLARTRPRGVSPRRGVPARSRIRSRGGPVAPKGSRQSTSWACYRTRDGRRRTPWHRATVTAGIRPVPARSTESIDTGAVTLTAARLRDCTAAVCAHFAVPECRFGSSARLIWRVRSEPSRPPGTVIYRAHDFLCGLVTNRKGP